MNANDAAGPRPPGAAPSRFGAGIDPALRTWVETTELHDRLAADLTDVSDPWAVSDQAVEAALRAAGEGFDTARQLLDVGYDGEADLTGSANGTRRPGWWSVDSDAWWELLGRARGHDAALGAISWGYLSERLSAGTVAGASLSLRGLNGPVDRLALEAWLAPVREALADARVVATVAAEAIDEHGALIHFRRLRGPEPGFSSSPLPLYRATETADPHVVRGSLTSRRVDGRLVLEVESPGERPADWTLMADGRSVVISGRVVEALRRSHASGWSCEPVLFEGGSGNVSHHAGTPAQWTDPGERDGWPYLLRVTGRVGVPNWAAAVPVIVGERATSQVAGWPIEPQTWDGCDVCAVEGTGEIVLSHRVALALEDAGCFTYDAALDAGDSWLEPTLILTPLDRVRTRRTAQQLAVAGMTPPDYLWLREPVEQRPAPLR